MRLPNLYERALEIREFAFGRESVKVAETLNNMAGLQTAKGSLGRAEKLYKRSLTMREKLLGTQDPNVALVLNNLGELYRIQKKYEIALPLFRRSLKIYEKQPGSISRCNWIHSQQLGSDISL